MRFNIFIWVILSRTYEIYFQIRGLFFYIFYLWNTQLILWSKFSKWDFKHVFVWDKWDVLINKCAHLLLKQIFICKVILSLDNKSPCMDQNIYYMC